MEEDIKGILILHEERTLRADMRNEDISETVRDRVVNEIIETLNRYNLK
jgi:hypothetical protein